MSKQVTVINVSPVAQAVPGYGEAAPGQGLKVAPRVATHLLKSEAWQEPKAAKQDPGRKAAPKEVSNGAD